MSIYATKAFTRFAKKAGVGTPALISAAREVAEGRFDADLGGGVFKQRIAREGGGASRGFRTIVLFRAGSHSFFVHGFAKNAKGNVSAQELAALRRLSKVYLDLSEDEVRRAAAAGEIIEVTSEP